MTSLGTFILHRFNGDEQFRLGRAIMIAYKTEDGVNLSFEAETLDPAEKTLPDTEPLHAIPSAEVVVALSALDLDELKGRRFTVDGGMEQNGEWVGRIYYCEHENLEENIIEVLDRRQDFFHIRWTGTTVDVNFYDGSKPRTRVEIDGWFLFQEPAQWSKRIQRHTEA